MTTKNDYMRPMVKHIDLDETLLASESLPFGEGKVSAEEADAECYGLFDESTEGMRTKNRKCWDDL